MMRSLSMFFACSCTLFFAATSIFADDVDAAFVKGNEFYRQNDYTQAIAEYQKILDQGFESWEVYYNLGNAYYKQGNVGRAILNFERAKRLNPENDDVNFNLELVNLATADRIQEIPDFFLGPWISRVANIMSLNLHGYLTLALFVILMGLLVSRTLVPRLRESKIVLLSLTANLVLLGLFVLALSFRVYDRETKAEAILLASKTDVQSAPGEAGTTVFTLHEGVKFQIEDQSLDWIKIKLADGKVGWMQQELVEKI